MNLCYERKHHFIFSLKINETTNRVYIIVQLKLNRSDLENVKSVGFILRKRYAGFQFSLWK